MTIKHDGPTKIPILDEKDLHGLTEQALKNGGNLVTPKGAYQMIINLPGVSIGRTPRKDGRYQGYVIENGKRFYAYGFTIEEVAYKLKRYIQYGVPKTRARKIVETINGAPTTFTAFSMYYFENFRKKKVAEISYKIDVRRFNKNLEPYFKETPLKKITPIQCQKLLDNITEQGKGKTADEVYSLMSVIFKMAIKHGIISKNPLDIVYHEKHNTESGKALTREEETLLKEKLQNTKFLNYCMLSLYTGLRPNEIKTARIENDFIIAINSKRKNKKIEYKRIPIIKALKPHLKNGIPTIERAEEFRKAFKTVLPNHKLYDMRTTFYSRCKEYGVSEHALSEYMGHSLGAIANAYTDLSDEFLLKEAKKLDLWGI